MTRDNVLLTEFAREEWERMGIHLDPDPPAATTVFASPDGTTGPGRWDSYRGAIVPDAHTAADPLTVEETSWQVAAAASDHGGAPAMLGLVMLSCAFALGVVVGWVVWHG